MSVTKPNRLRELGKLMCLNRFNNTFSDICMVPNFLYNLSGKVSTTVEICGRISLSNDQIYEIMIFHEYIFKEVIGCQNSWMWVSPDCSSNGCMVVPINGKKKIDFEQIKMFSNYKSSDQIQGKFVYNENDYRNAVIRPKQKPEEHFFVEEIMQGTNPDSFLDEKTMTTFKEYYNKKFKFNSTNDQQELLRVSGADHRHFMYSKVAKKKSEKSRSTERDPKYLPEFVSIEPLLASLWREAQMIPFVMERLNFLIR